MPWADHVGCGHLGLRARGGAWPVRGHRLPISESQLVNRGTRRVKFGLGGVNGAAGDGGSMSLLGVYGILGKALW